MVLIVRIPITPQGLANPSLQPNATITALRPHYHENQTIHLLGAHILSRHPNIVR